MSDLCNLYEIDYTEINNFIIENRVERILIQAPNGLKKLILCILRNIDVKKYRVFISSSPTYGGCDLVVDEAIKLGVDAIIHIGHNEYPYIASNVNIPVLYIPAYYSWKPSREVINKIIELLHREKAFSVGLVSTIQHVKSIGDLNQILEEKGFKTYVGKPSSSQLMNGQIIGCDYSTIYSIDDRVDVYLVLSGGLFHALGLALITDKKVFGIDPYSERITSISEYARKILAKRKFLLTKLKYSGFKTIGIIIGTKLGQFRQGIVEKIVELSEENNIEYYCIVSGELNTERLIAIDNALQLDAYVVTSCPRLPIDDLGDFYKPVLTPGEYFMLFEKEISKYIYPW